MHSFAYNYINKVFSFYSFHRTYCVHHFPTPLNHFGTLGSEPEAAAFGLKLPELALGRVEACDVHAEERSAGAADENSSPRFCEANFKAALDDEIFSMNSCLMNGFVSLESTPKCSTADGTQPISKSLCSFDKIVFGGVITVN